MSGLPLTREERDDHRRQPLLAAYGPYVEALRDNYEATVQAAEERAERLRAALVPLKASHDALIASVTPPNCVDVPSDEYDALFSEWHAATRSCIAALAADAADDSARGDR